MTVLFTNSITFMWPSITISQRDLTSPLFVLHFGTSLISLAKKQEGMRVTRTDESLICKCKPKRIKSKFNS